MLSISVSPKYTVKIINRGEQMIYSDTDITLGLECTHINGLRVYCSGTESYENGMIEFKKRTSIIKNICDYFDSMHSSIILVIEENDKDRLELENYFARMISRGHQITIEYDSPEMRAESQKIIHLSLLEAGKKLTINGIKFDNVEQYLSYYNSPKNSEEL